MKANTLMAYIYSPSMKLTLTLRHQIHLYQKFWSIYLVHYFKLVIDYSYRSSFAIDWFLLWIEFCYHQLFHLIFAIDAWLFAIHQFYISHQVSFGTTSNWTYVSLSFWALQQHQLSQCFISGSAECRQHQQNKDRKLDRLKWKTKLKENGVWGLPE